MEANKGFDSPGGRHYHCALMSRGSLPQYVEPFRLCDADARLAGRLAASKLERISEFSLGQIEDVNVELRFWRDDDRRCRISGTVDTVLQTHCERCLEPLSLPLHAEVALLAVRAGSDAPETSEDVEIVEVEDERLLLAPLVEEEVLLALPQYPVHAQCEMISYDRRVGAPEGEAAHQKKESAFAALASLKQQKDQ